MSKNKFIPIEKQTKKAQKARNATQRNSWMGVKPATITFPDRKKFNKADRSREKAALRCGF